MEIEKIVHMVCPTCRRLHPMYVCDLEDDDINCPECRYKKELESGD